MYICFMDKEENIVRTEESIMELPITVPSLETIRKTGDSILMLGLQEMGKILLVGIVLSSPILSFIVLILVLGMIGVIAQLIVDLMGNALDAAKARIEKLFAKK